MTSGLNRCVFGKASMASVMPTYLVRHLAGNFEELSCFVQLEDESAAMYFNIVHGSKLRRKVTTENSIATYRPCQYASAARQIFFANVEQSRGGRNFASPASGSYWRPPLETIHGIRLVNTVKTTAMSSDDQELRIRQKLWDVRLR
jgi:hypothetical protein